MSDGAFAVRCNARCQLASYREAKSGKSSAVVVDVVDELAAAGLTARQIMVPVDGHPNRIWHEIVARRLYDTIKGLHVTPVERGARASAGSGSN